MILKLRVKTPQNPMLFRIHLGFGVRMGEALDRLKPQWRAFVENYVIGETAGEKAKSYLAAGYRCGYSAAAASATNLLKRPAIIRAINELKTTVVDVQTEHKILTHHRRLEILADIAENADKDSDRIAALKLDAQLQAELPEESNTVMIQVVIGSEAGAT